MAISADNLEAIIDTSRDLDPFIAFAQIIVDEELADKGLSAERQDLIGLYLAAHFLAITEEKGGIIRERQGEADVSYRGVNEMESGLRLTLYGQQAMMLDTSGTLAAMDASKRLKARFEVVTSVPTVYGYSTI